MRKGKKKREEKKRKKGKRNQEAENSITQLHAMPGTPL